MYLKVLGKRAVGKRAVGKRDEGKREDILMRGWESAGRDGRGVM